MAVRWTGRLVLIAAIVLLFFALFAWVFDVSTPSLAEPWVVLAAAVTCSLSQLDGRTRGVTLRLEKLLLAALLAALVGMYIKAASLAYKGLPSALYAQLRDSLPLMRMLILLLLVSAFEFSREEGFRAAVSPLTLGVDAALTVGACLVYTRMIVVDAVQTAGTCGTGIYYTIVRTPAEALDQTVCWLAPMVAGCLLTLPGARLRERGILAALLLPVSAAYAALGLYPIVRGLFFGQPVHYYLALRWAKILLLGSAGALPMLALASLRHLAFNGRDGSGGRLTIAVWPRPARPSRQEETPQ